MWGKVPRGDLVGEGCGGSCVCLLTEGGVNDGFTLPGGRRESLCGCVQAGIRLWEGSRHEVLCFTDRRLSRAPPPSGGTFSPSNPQRNRCIAAIKGALPWTQSGALGTPPETPERQFLMIYRS